MRLLDLFCGAGGAALGYAAAGFEVVGVDVKAQRNYPFEFHQADVFAFLGVLGSGSFDVIHASPPCQAYSNMKNYKNYREAYEHPDLVAETRERVKRFGKPYVIENVEGSPLRAQLMLCGSMFGLRSDRGYLRRHRFFELGNTDCLIMSPPCQHTGVAIGVYGHGSAGLSDQRFRTANAAEARELMGTPTMTRDGMSQAIPPAYTEFIGRHLMGALAR